MVPSPDFPVIADTLQLKTKSDIVVLRSLTSKIKYDPRFGADVAEIIIILLRRFGGTVIDCLEDKFKPKLEFQGWITLLKLAVLE